MATFRSILRFLVPSWLYDAITQSHADILDESIDRARAGLEARFPTRAQPDALTLIGQDRGIPRGRVESAAHYVQRLIGWRYPKGHRVRGSAFALLHQISEYFGGVSCATVDAKGNHHGLTGNVESFSYSFPWTWDTDPRLGRFWVILVPGALMSAQPSFGDPALWGGATGTPGYSVGQLGAQPEDAEAMRALFTGDCPWKPAGSLPMWMCIALDGTPQTPDATWAHWSKNVAGLQVTSRYSGWRFWPLFAGANDYSGDRTNPATTITLPSGGTYTGARIFATGTITLSSGATYSGNRAKAASKITLVDDGGVPV